MKKLFLIFLLSNFLFACALCQLQVPKVDVYIDSDYNKDKLLFSVKWVFEKNFSNETKLAYDTNINNKLEKSEIASIQKALEEYLEKDSFLTFIDYGKYNNNLNPKIIYVTNTKLYYDNLNMVYEYKFYLPIDLQPEHNLKIDINDVNNFFVFHIKKFKVDGYDGYFKKSFQFSKAYFLTHKHDIDLSSLKTNEETQDIPIKQSTKENIEKKEVKKDIKEEVKTNFIQQIFSKLKQKLEDLLEDIKNNNSLASYFLLLFFSFLYGVVHAVGPGHGKSLVGAYFLSQNRSYSKAFMVSALIGVVHTFSAATLTFVLYYIINTYLANVYPNIEQATIRFSAIIIILIAFYLIYKKYKSSKNTLIFNTKANNFSIITPYSLSKNINLHQNSCGCNSCKNSNTTDIGVVLAAGIVPCPGTITIFVFTMSLGLYFIGFISAVMMSLGMSIVIFLISVFSLKVQKTIKSKTTFMKFLEYGSLAFILLLGVLLFFY